MLVTVPRNTFVRSIAWATSPQVADPHQFNGFSIQTTSYNCPQLYGTLNGTGYCPSLCINTCQNLNPDKQAAAVAMVAQYAAELPHINSAINASEYALAPSLQLVTLSATVTFPLPANISSSVMKAVMHRIQTQLPSYARAFTVIFTVRP